MAENLFLGRKLGRWGLVDDRRMRRVAAEKLAEIGCAVSPNDDRVGAIPLADKQLVQIATALLDEHKIVIFDEPTAVLTGEEVLKLQDVILRLKARGIAVLYISHRLDEVQRLADKVTVLRDGKLIGSYPGRTLSQMDMARLMVGRELAALYPSKTAVSIEAPILCGPERACRRLCRQSLLHPAQGRDSRLRGHDRRGTHGALRGPRRTETRESVGRT